MRKPWTVGSRVTLGLALVAAGLLALAGCARLSSPTTGTSPSGSPISTPSPSASTSAPAATPSAPTPEASAAGTVTISSQDSGSTIELLVGQELLVDLPSAPSGESSTEAARSSDLSVLRSLAAAQPGVGLVTLAQVRFRALAVGAATVTVTGSNPFSVQIVVVTS
jgi:hypothetical protein